MVKSLYRYMKKVPDPRCSRKKRHDCAVMLTILVAGYILGRCSLERCREWAERNRWWLSRHLDLSGGIPSVPTMSRMLSNIDEDEFTLVFIQWMTEMLKQSGNHIAVDGKGLRAAAEKIKGENTPYVLNVIDVDTALVIAQLPIPSKTNEITTIPEVLQLISLRDNTITIDAIGTQVSVMETIIAGGGHYLLTVKKNNPAVYDEIMGFFTMIENQMASDSEKNTPDGIARLAEITSHYSEASTKEKNRERIEYRKCRSYIGGTVECRDEPVFGTVMTTGVAESIRILIKKDKDGNDITPESGNREVVGMIADTKMDAEKMSEMKRRHWAIENSLHHVLDCDMHEDRSPAKKSKNNLSLIRKFAYNILRIAMIREGKGDEYAFISMMDEFADRQEELLSKYVFGDLESFY